MQSKPIIQCLQLIPGELPFEFTGDALDLELHAGERVSIIGPNYSGKGHWLKTICGLEEQRSGRLEINGIDTLDMSADDWVKTRTKVTYIHADTALLSAANGLINTMIPALYHGMEQDQGRELLAERALDILEEIDPHIDLDELPAYLTKEHRYKIAVARALLLKPDVLALNNPFAHFNKDSRSLFETFLSKQAKKGLCLIMVVHDVDYAINNSDRIIFTDRENLYQFHSNQAFLNCGIPIVNNFIQSNT